MDFPSDISITDELMNFWIKFPRIHKLYDRKTGIIINGVEMLRTDVQQDDYINKVMQTDDYVYKLWYDWIELRITQLHVNH